MADGSRRGVIFLTAPLELSRLVLQHAMGRFHGTAWTVYHRADQTEGLADLLAGHEARIDKPSGSKLAFVRRIRSGRYDLAVVIWGGHRSYDRMKLVALGSAARQIFVYNENVDSFPIEGGSDPTWLRHVRWRLSNRPRRVVPLSVWLAAYRWTIGWVVGWTLTAFGALRWELRARRRRVRARNS